jgi:hypothetical protein
VGNNGGRLGVEPSIHQVQTSDNRTNERRRERGKVLVWSCAAPQTVQGMQVEAQGMQVKVLFALVVACLCCNSRTSTVASHLSRPPALNPRNARHACRSAAPPVHSSGRPSPH